MKHIIICWISVSNILIGDSDPENIEAKLNNFLAYIDEEATTSTTAKYSTSNEGAISGMLST